MGKPLAQLISLTHTRLPPYSASRPYALLRSPANLPPQGSADAPAGGNATGSGDRRVWRWVDALEAADGGGGAVSSTLGEEYFSGTAFVYILTATWDASRSEHAHDVCARLSPASGSVCHVIEGVNGRTLSPADKQDFEKRNFVTLAPLPERPWWRLPLPGLLRPLGKEYPENMLKYPGGLGNTLGNIFILKMMQRVANTTEAGDDAVFIYLEDDADVGDPLELVERVKVMRRDLPPGSWDLISLAPPEATCERSRLLPTFPRSGLIRPRLSFSRTAAVVYSKRCACEARGRAGDPCLARAAAFSADSAGVSHSLREHCILTPRVPPLPVPPPPPLPAASTRCSTTSPRTTR